MSLLSPRSCARLSSGTGKWQQGKWLSWVSPPQTRRLLCLTENRKSCSEEEVWQQDMWTVLSSLCRGWRRNRPAAYTLPMVPLMLGVSRQSEAQLLLLILLWKEWLIKSVNTVVFFFFSFMPNINTSGEKCSCKTSSERNGKQAKFRFCLQDNWQPKKLSWLQNNCSDHRWLYPERVKSKAASLQHPSQASCSVAATGLLWVPRQKRLDPVATLCWTINQWYLLYLCTIFRGTQQHLHLGSICLKLKCSCYISSASKVWC